MNLKKWERYLRVNLLGPGLLLIKKYLPSRGLTKLRNTVLEGLGLLFEVPWSHSVRPLQTSDRPVAETSTWHTTITRDIRVSFGVLILIPSKLSVADPWFRPRGPGNNKICYRKPATGAELVTWREVLSGNSVRRLLSLWKFPSGKCSRTFKLIFLLPFNVVLLTN